MERPTCRTCPYWDLEDYESDCPDFGGTDEEMRSHLDTDCCCCASGECRRYPRQTEGMVGRCMVTYWPRSLDSDWCGEHPDFPAYIASLKKRSVSA